MTRIFTRASYGYAALLAVTLGYFLLRIPIQVNDSFVNIAVLDRPFWDLMLDIIAQPGYLRPGIWAALKGVYDLSGGDYFYWYRWTQVLQVVAVIWLFIRLVRPTTAAGAAVLPLALAVLVGSHTFAWTVREAFPINTFLTIVVLCLAAVNLVFANYRWWNDVGVAILFVVAALTVESGLLVGVIVVGGKILRLRGVSTGGTVAVVALMLAYFWIRFGLLSVGVPSLADREAGFGFERYGGPELVSMFGASPLGFYVYNVVSSITGVLTAEPRDGVWRLTRSFVEGTPDSRLIVSVLASGLATGVLCRFGWRRRRAWRDWNLQRDDQLVLLFVLVLVANATMSYAYTKDVIMSPAGVFFAAAVFPASRDVVELLPMMGRGGRAAAVLVLATLSVTWGIRQVGIHAGLARTSVQVREQWAYIGDWIEQRYDEPGPSVTALSRHLQDDAVIRHPAKMPIREQWTRLFETE